MSRSYVPTSHEAFSHDSINNLGYDWERVAAPEIAPRHPLKVYFPRDAEEVSAILKEMRLLAQPLRIRSKGHSSNDLVLVDRGAVLCTQSLDSIADIDENSATIRVGAGAVLTDVDQRLHSSGHGLPIIGDHNHITAGGFASVGGISPASHKYGLFVDNVEALEYVDWTGEIRTCSRKQGEDGLWRILCGTGQYGVITSLTLRIVKIDKDATILKNGRFLTTDVDKYVARTYNEIRKSHDVVMERGVWMDIALFGGTVTIGQFSPYRSASVRWWGALRSRISYGYLHALGYWAGRLPNWLDAIVKYLGILGVIFSPRYASVRNVESFTDKVMDFTVGEPSRMFIVLAPISEYPALFKELYKMFRHVRAQSGGGVTFIAIYVKAITSRYLGQGGEPTRFCELMLLVGMDPSRIDAAAVELLVSQIDDTTIRHGAYRYMHTKTVKDVARRRRIDPNARFDEHASEASPTAGEPR